MRKIDFCDFCDAEYTQNLTPSEIDNIPSYDESKTYPKRQKLFNGFSIELFEYVIRNNLIKGYLEKYFLHMQINRYSLIPTNKHIEYVHVVGICYILKKCNELNYYINNIPIKTLINPEGKHKKQWATKKCNDLQNRAKILVDIFIHQNVNKIMFMDGHCRFTYFLLKTLMETNIEKNITLILVDIDRNAIDYHKAVLPNKLTYGKMNITFEHKYSNVFDLLNPDLTPYLNFCGINFMNEINILFEKYPNSWMFSCQIDPRNACLENKTLVEYLETHTKIKNYNVFNCGLFYTFYSNIFF